MQRSRTEGAVREIKVTDRRERDRFIAVERAAIADSPLAIREIAGDVHQRLRGVLRSTRNRSAPRSWLS